MALKIGYSSRVQSTPTTPQENSNNAPGITRVLSGLGTSAAGFAGNVAQLPQDVLSYVGNAINEKFGGGDQNAPKLPWQKPGSYAETHKETKGQENPFTINELRNRVAEETGYSRKSLEPQGHLEKAGNFVAGEAVPFYLSGGFKGYQQAINAGKTLLGLHAGSKVGKEGSKALGFGEVGQTVGSLVGGLAGSVFAHNIGNPRLSKQLFNKDKQERVKLAKESHNILEKEIANLEKERTTNYALAKKEGKLIRELAPEVEDALKAVESEIQLGVLPDESKKILTMLEQLNDHISNGTLNLDTATTFKKNLNAAIYDRNLPTTVKKYYGDINRGLNKFIANIGEKHPQHGNPFRVAEEQTKKLAELKKIYESSDVENLVKDISKEKYTDFLDRVFEEQGVAVEDALSNTKLTLSDAALSGISYAVGGPLVGKSVTAGKALYKLGKAGANEIKSVKRILEHNPKLGKELTTALNAAVKRDYPMFAYAMTNFDKEISSKMPNKEKTKQAGLKIGY